MTDTREQVAETLEYAARVAKAGVPLDREMIAWLERAIRLLREPAVQPAGEVREQIARAFEALADDPEYLALISAHESPRTLSLFAADRILVRVAPVQPASEGEPQR